MKFILKLAYETAKAKCFLGTLLQYELFPEKSWFPSLKNAEIKFKPSLRLPKLLSHRSTFPFTHQF